MTQASVIAIGDDVPPETREEGECWVVGNSPTGEWSGRAATLAGWTAGGWRFVAPVEGMAVWDISHGLIARFAGSGWVRGEVAAARVMIDGVQVLGARQAAIAAPVGGSVIDSESRAALTGILAALRVHGLIEN